MAIEPISEVIRLKAKKYRVNPKFLLFAIAALCKDPEARESDVSNQYFDALSRDFEKQAKEQLKSKRKGYKEGGEMALTPIRELESISKYFTDEDIEKIRAYVPADMPVLHLHSVAYNHLTADQIRIRRKWREAGYKSDGELDAIQIIKLLCPELIDKFKEMIILSEWDLSLN